MTGDTSRDWAYRISLFSACAAMIAVFVIVALQIYVRWKINQEFTFLGGNELEVLTVCSFATLFGIAYLNQRATRQT